MKPLNSLPIIFLLLSVAAPAHAYLDPGTGSILLQGLIAAIASVGFYAKMHWHAVKAWFNKGSSDEDENKADDDNEKNHD